MEMVQNIEQLRGLCGRRVCARLCSRVEYCSVGQQRVRNLWGRRVIARGQIRQLPLFDSSRTYFLLPSQGGQVL